MSDSHSEITLKEYTENTSLVMNLDEEGNGWLAASYIHYLITSYHLNVDEKLR